MSASKKRALNSSEDSPINTKSKKPRKSTDNDVDPISKTIELLTELKTMRSELEDRERQLAEKELKWEKTFDKVSTELEAAQKEIKKLRSLLKHQTPTPIKNPRLAPTLDETDPPGSSAHSAWQAEHKQMLKRIKGQRKRLLSPSPFPFDQLQIGQVDENSAWETKVACLHAGYPATEWEPVSDAPFKLREMVHFLFQRKWTNGVIVGVARTDHILRLMQADHDFAKSVRDAKLFPIGGLLLPLAAFSNTSQLPPHHRYCYAIAKKSSKSYKTMDWFVEPLVSEGWLAKDSVSVKDKEAEEIGAVTPPKLMLSGEKPPGCTSFWPPAYDES